MYIAHDDHPQPLGQPATTTTTTPFAYKMVILGPWYLNNNVLKRFKSYNRRLTRCGGLRSTVFRYSTQAALKVVRSLDREERLAQSQYSTMQDETSQILSSCARELALR